MSDRSDVFKPMLVFRHTETGKEIFLPKLESYNPEDIIALFVQHGHSREECEAVMASVLGVNANRDRTPAS